MELTIPGVGHGPAARHDAAVAADQPVVALRRSTIDRLLVASGMVVAVVLAVAGGLLTWGSSFATDYVHDELAAQRVTFPDEAALSAEGRTDLLSRAGEQVTDGDGARAYASYIAHHLDGVADGATYADLSGPERAARAAVTEAREAGAPEAEITALQAESSAITGQRDTLFKGETLRGLLLSTFAWATIGKIAGIAAAVAFAAAVAMLGLVLAGLVHLRKAARH